MLPEITSWEIMLENILVIRVGCNIYVKEFEAVAVAVEFTIIIDKKIC